MKYPFKSLLLAATVLAAASCAKDDTQSGGEETAGPVIVNASPAAIGGEIILKLKTEASGIVEKSRAQGVSKGSGIDEIDRILNTVNTVRFERLFPDGGRFEERTRREGLHLWYYAKYDPSVPTSEMASLLSSCKDIEIIEIEVSDRMVGKTIVDMDLRRRYSLNVIAIHHEEQIETDVRPDCRLCHGDTITVIGKEENVTRFADDYS